MKWYIGLDNGYCGLEEADTKTQARTKAKQNIKGMFGEPAKDYDPDIIEVRPALADDLSWVSAMSGSTR